MKYSNERENGIMKYRVNEECIGCGLCAGTCPEVFSMGADGVAVAIETNDPEEALDSAAGVRDRCTGGARGDEQG